MNYFIVFGEQHMDYIVSEMVTHYHEERPHWAKDNDPLGPAKSAKALAKPKRRKAESLPEISYPCRRSSAVTDSVDCSSIIRERRRRRQAQRESCTR